MFTMPFPMRTFPPTTLINVERSDLTADGALAVATRFQELASSVNTIAYMFHGWGGDSREVYEIPEIQRWCGQLLRSLDHLGCKLDVLAALVEDYPRQDEGFGIGFGPHPFMGGMRTILVARRGITVLHLRPGRCRLKINKKILRKARVLMRAAMELRDRSRPDLAYLYALLNSRPELFAPGHEMALLEAVKDYPVLQDELRMAGLIGA